MVLHVFNPSHDEALAANYPYYYPSTIARKLEADWGALPALWAQRGDSVWLTAPDAKRESVTIGKWCAGVRFVTRKDLTPHFWEEVERVEPWGWDPLLCHTLRKALAPRRLLPDERQLSIWRELSSRATTEMLLPLLRTRLQLLVMLPTIGDSRIIHSEEELYKLLTCWNSVIVKSLWSCSGRGVFRIGKAPTASDRGRIARLLREQGGLEVQTACSPVQNFALEYTMFPSGRAHYEGLSIFSAGQSGAYMGNCIDAQSRLRKVVSSCLPCSGWLDNVIKICGESLAEIIDGQYVGPLGVDMMVAETPMGPALMPCVEVNMRRTMGHAAIAISRRGLSLADIPENMRSLWLV